MQKLQNIFIALCAVAFLIGITVSAPFGFPVGSHVVVEKGAGSSSIAQSFKEAGVVRSSTIFAVVLKVFGSRNIKAGDYALPHEESMFSLASRLLSGDFGYPMVKLTIPEGLTIKQIAVLASAVLPDFNPAQFEALALGKEGYLFPDTYFFTQSVHAEDVYTAMTAEFDQKIATLAVDIAVFGKANKIPSASVLKQVVTMASILEEEARTPETRKTVAGILWKRISVGMALQVDSSLRYISGKTSAQMTLADLQTDSAYNTYTRRGLPPTPISNPGLDALTDAINPTQSPYFYFLSDSQGVMHYAVTLDEHDQNRAKYLK